VTLGRRQRLAVAFRQQYVARDPLGLDVPFAEGGVVLGAESGDIGAGLFHVAPEDQRRAVEMRLGELVARRDVFHPVRQAQVAEPG
jgi:hypothetical protein